MRNLRTMLCLLIVPFSLTALAKPIEWLVSPSAVAPPAEAALDGLPSLDVLTDTQIVEMLDSGDPRLIGIGIQAADRRRMLDLLLSYSRFAEDARRTLPLLLKSVHPDIEPFERPQTVAEFYRGVMDCWFGVWPLTEQEVLDAVPEGSDPWDFARPWAVNIHRTALRDDPALMQALLDDLRMRPEALRALVIGWTFSMGASPPPITVEDARAVLQDIPAASMRSMRELEEGLPPDAALKNAEFRDRLLDVALQIRTGEH